MDKAIKKLRKKYIISASLISFSVILLMLILLNVITFIVFRSSNRNAHEVIQQAAHSYDYNTETFLLSEMEKNKDGDYIIPRSVDSIDSVTLKGEITSETPTQGWYSAGGGLMFRLAADGTEKFAYREYTFNKNTSEVTIDFNDDSTLRFEKYALLNESGVTDDNFLVSIVWWTSSDNNSKDDISLKLDSVTIHYNADFTKRNIMQMSYQNLFKNDIPTVLNETSSFFMVSDKNRYPIAVCSGNLTTHLQEQEVTEIMSTLSESDGTVKINSSVSYQYLISEKNGIIVYSFIQNSSANKNSTQVLVISAILGIVIFIVLFGIIVFVSGKIVAPISDGFEKQKQFISNAGHELKTPITVISATTDLLERKHGNDRLLDTIKAQSDKMGNLVSELLELSRLSEINENKTQFSHFSVSDIVNNTILYFESRAFEEQHELEMDIDDGLTMYGDSRKIERLMGILLDNALKYADAQSKIRITLSEQKGYIILTCSNRCAEINHEHISHLFERFYRAEESHSNKKEGFGLGLSIAQAITELHKGEISVSLNDNTVIFKVHLPK